MASGQSFPAGQYTIERAGFGSSVLVIRGEHGNRRAALVGVRPAGEPSPASDRPALQFRKHENEYRLTAVWESATNGLDLIK